MRSLIFIVGLVLTLVSASVAIAAPRAQHATPHVMASLTASHDAATPGETVRLLLTLDIIPGWHVYWQNPGDSGEPTSMKVALGTSPPAPVSLSWPSPHAVPYMGLVNYGYEGRVSHSTDIRVPANWPVGTPLPISAEATLLVCEDICIPETVRFTLALPVGAQSQPSAIVADLLTRHDQSLPRPSPWDATFEDSGTDMVLAVNSPDFDGAALEKAEFFSSRWGVIDHAAPQSLTIDKTGLRLALTRGADALRDEETGVLVLTERSGAETIRTGYQLAGPVTKAAPPPSMANGLLMMLFAFVGGLILNLMPCVFPVLAIKAFALVGHADDKRARISGGLGYTAGVLASFAALGLALILFKQAGAVVGWGFQLQSPAVIFGLAAIMLLVGLNLSGVFSVGTRIMALGGNAPASSFLTGVLATIVAAPCTAPFMATAIGAALTQPAAIGLLIFLALGFGLALPYLALSLSPALARALPKPGAWMDRLKHALAFPMYATLVWLVWVLGQQVSEPDLLALMLALVALAFAVWAVAQSPAVLRAVGALALIAALGVSVPSLSSPAPAPAVAHDARAEAYSAARLAELRAAHKPVFVNLTAAWCITCKVNERTALSSEAFYAALEANGVSYLVGDWTNRDDEITTLLEAHGRAGVPLYLVYPPQGEPTILPQILTPSVVGKALQDTRE